MSLVPRRNRTYSKSIRPSTIINSRELGYYLINTSPIIIQHIRHHAPVTSTSPDFPRHPTNFIHHPHATCWLTFMRTEWPPPTSIWTAERGWSPLDTIRSTQCPQNSKRVADIPYNPLLAFCCSLRLDGNLLYRRSSSKSTANLQLIHVMKLELYRSWADLKWRSDNWTVSKWLNYNDSDSLRHLPVKSPVHYKITKTIQTFSQKKISTDSQY
jgi:hypothetical protein